MTTRKISADTDYPFVPPLTAAESSATAGILDLWFVIQGRHDSSASSGTSSGEELPDIHLTHYEAGSSTTEFMFDARKDDRVWKIRFQVPAGGNSIGQVSNVPWTDAIIVGTMFSQAVLVFDSGKIVSSGSSDVSILVEPCRAQWHTEEVESLSLFNIWRCAGSESSDSLIPVDGITSSSSSLDLKLTDGFNCHIDASSGSLEITAGGGLGTGKATDYGNTAESACASSEMLDLATDAVTVVNGQAPSNGNIPVDVSKGFKKQRSDGRLELIVSQ